ncbi:MAG: hypothetical protein PUH24_09370 [Prevotellaceae bacterium]|uniref:hypothetical protein n=1 Tax=Prevotella sp. TaxID=59823 RepID=UPI002A814F83|nr:hypothetical protein [Prevotella sp.]MDD7258456.1 hypothetical protein [Prevotellaceae bacterium]MDY4020076.1 hypothetical protein [Prevotella sp.]MDY6130153.1 hypothetical protein [Prevotella sp.]
MEEITEKIRPLLVGLGVGESISFPIARMKSVRTQASELGAIHNRQYVTRTNRSEQIITVTRIS